MSTLPNADALAAARESFLTHGKVPDGLVPDTILRSWQRCAAIGLDMTALGKIEPMEAKDLKEHCERNEQLRILSRPELAILRTDAKATDSMVILTDPTGLVLDTSGSLDFAKQAARVSLQPGVAWLEANTGTNAIGTAIVEQRPVEVLGAEHFFEPHRILSCTAVPIIDPYGRLTGILDLSGHAAIHPVHALGLVRLAAEQIEHRYFNQGFDNCMIVRFHKEGAYLGTPREAILVFDEDHPIAANRHALALLGLDRSAFASTTLDEIFKNIRPGREQQKLSTHRGKNFVAQVTKSRSASQRRIPSSVFPDEITPVYDRDARADLDKAVRLIDANIPLLIQGETGTGKEIFARQLHARCVRSDRPFVAINCAAIPESLIESELFGYTDGAFTGARRNGRLGLIQQAHTGILFLDEIGDMPLALQCRLLRVLQDKEILPLGSSRAEQVDFAVICATHQPLRTLVETGGFRADLYFRIAQHSIMLKPLREVRDRAHVIRSIWAQLAGDEAPDMPPEAIEALITYRWPGNYRQLTGTLRAAAALIEPGGILEPRFLPVEIFEPAAEAYANRLDVITDNAMRAALADAKGNVSRAARALGIDRSTFYRRIIRKRET